ncbi:MAG: prepilin peptidase [Butyrivibrio sp.]|nr:prepilin peptidase [Butyrivibrio sp.]
MDKTELGIIVVLIFIAMLFDIRKKKIPLYMIFFIGIISVAMTIYNMIFGNERIEEVAAGLFPGITLFIVSFLTKEGIGYGDCFIILFAGMILGIEKMIMILMTAFVLSSILSVFLFVLKKVNRKSTLPFVPFLFLGMGVTIFV